MDTYIILKNSIGDEIGEFEVFPGEEIDTALVRLLRTRDICCLEEGDSIEIVSR